MLEFGTKALSSWEEAAEEYPALREDSDFSRAGALLAVAAQQYAKAAATDPTDPTALVCAAIQSLGAGDRAAAAGYVESALRLAPGRPDTLAVAAADPGALAGDERSSVVVEAALQAAGVSPCGKWRRSRCPGCSPPSRPPCTVEPLYRSARLCL